MKRIAFALFTVLLLSTMLAACGGGDPAPVSSSGTSEASSSSLLESEPVSNASEPAVSSSMPEIIVDRNPYPGQTSMGGKEFSLQMFSADPEQEPATITLTLQQQNTIAQELQSVMARYSSGDYPLERAEDDDSAGFYPEWPTDVDYPKTAPVKQLIFSTVGHSVYPMSVQVALPKGWFMECALVVDAADGADIDYSTEDNYWIPVTAHFIDPNGLVHDNPGGTAIDDGVTIVQH